jgi:glutamyl-tRNA reductase
MSGICVVGLNHKSAPVELREKCTVDDLDAMLTELHGFAREVVLLSTCNRFEIYAAGLEDPEHVREWIARRAEAPVERIREHAYAHEGRNAAKHLFFVAASLDSLVVGETQIRGQVKEAYRRATDAGTTGPALHGLFQAALRLSKEISEKTGVGRGNVSVAGAAADLAKQVFGDLEKAKVLVVGAGETAELVINHLQSRGVTDFRVVNRSVARAEELALRLGGHAAGLDRLEESLPEADVVVAAAAGDQPLVTAPSLRAAIKRRRGKPIVAIDIAMPRAVDPAAARVDNVYCYDMEALEAVTRDALRHRRQEFIQCCTMVDAATLRLVATARARNAGQTISQLKEAYQAVAADELAALERRIELGDEERAKVRKAVHRIVNKLLHGPMKVIREGGEEEHEVLRRALIEEKDGR